MHVDFNNHHGKVQWSTWKSPDYNSIVYS